MKTLLALIFTLVLTATAWAGNGSGNLSLKVPEKARNTNSVPRAQLNRGPFQTRSVRHQGVELRYQEGAQGANWAELSGGRLVWGKGKLRVSAAPTILIDRAGKTGVGANLQVQLSHLVKVNHTSHLGGLQRHQTMVVLAPGSPVSAQVMRVGGPQGVVTRVGPSVKLGKNLRLWHGVATDDSHDLTLLTGNLRF